MMTLDSIAWKFEPASLLGTLVNRSSLKTSKAHSIIYFRASTCEIHNLNDGQWMRVNSKSSEGALKSSISHKTASAI